MSDCQPIEPRDFAQELAAIYAALLKGQGPLGAEFEEAIGNTEELYES